MADRTAPEGQGSVVTVGTFDGVHLGHQDVLRRLAARAQDTGLRSLLVSFEPHPLEVVNPARAPLLLTPGIERLEAIAMSGIDRVAILPFTPALQQLSAERFVDEVLRERLGMRELLIGHDHGFGKGRSGDENVLRELGRSRGFPVEVVEAVTLPDGSHISSTAVRRMVAAGDLAGVAVALGRPYAATGVVAPGDGRGRGLGYPTLNVALADPRKLLPPHGVYAVRVDTPGGRFGGMMNLGPRPTFDDEAPRLEAHLFGARGDFYGRTVRVGFVARLRDTMKFPSAQALVEQLARDSDAAHRALTEVP